MPIIAHRNTFCAISAYERHCVYLRSRGRRSDDAAVSGEEGLEEFLLAVGLGVVVRQDVTLNGYQLG